MIHELKSSDKSLINSLIYTEMTNQSPTRNEMIKLSTWRAYLYNELQSVPSDRRDHKRINDTFTKQFPQLTYSEDRKQFYNFVFKPIGYNEKTYYTHNRNDNISHFICRMLYCQEESNHLTFVETQKRILEDRLRRLLGKNETADRLELMRILKMIMVVLKDKDSFTCYDIANEEWNHLKEPIIFNILTDKLRNDEFASLYARVPFAEAEAGIRKRRSYIHRGFVYIGTESMIDTVLSNYENYLRKKLELTRPIVQDLIVDDIENQLSAFLISTIKQINEEGMQDTKLNGKFNLTLKNIEALSGKYFPPCMLNLNQHLKISRHLKHDGRRQLWGFFKACGMDVHDNKQYFRKHLEGKVTASQMKTHLYNIEHAYGLQGKKKSENAWKCRNIITGTAPKKGEHHGCPFYHWRSQELGEFIRRNYHVTEQNLNEILEQKNQKRFQIACGRLFEYSEVNKCASIPPEITAKLAKAPYLYYEAGMELREKKLKDSEGSGTTMKAEKNGIDF